MDYHFQSTLAEQAASEARPAPSGWWRAACPFCPMLLGKRDRRGAFAVYAPTGRYHCFRCGTGGKLRNWVVPDEFTAGVAPRAKLTMMDPPEDYTPLWSYPGNAAECLSPARKYLRKRGITDSLWKLAKIGACDRGLFGGRIVVPIVASDGDTWLGYVGRTWVKSDFAYRYPEGMDRRAMLYNHAALLIETEEPAIIVEGVFDAIAVGLTAGVAVLGTPSESQIEALSSARRPVAVVLDGDAHEAGWGLAMRLRFEGARAGSVRLPPRLDPDEVPLDWLRAEARSCIA